MDIQTKIQIKRQTDRQMFGQVDRDTDHEQDRKTDRQINRWHSTVQVRSKPVSGSCVCGRLTSCVIRNLPLLLGVHALEKD